MATGHCGHQAPLSLLLLLLLLLFLWTFIHPQMCGCGDELGARECVRNSCACVAIAIFDPTVDIDTQTTFRMHPGEHTQQS